MNESVFTGYAKNKLWGCMHNRDIRYDIKLLFCININIFSIYKKRYKSLSTNPESNRYNLKYKRLRDNKRHFLQLSNMQLKGDTFDAKHIDQIIQSENNDDEFGNDNTFREASQGINKSVQGNKTIKLDNSIGNFII